MYITASDRLSTTAAGANFTQNYVLLPLCLLLCYCSFGLARRTSLAILKRFPIRRPHGKSETGTLGPPPATLDAVRLPRGAEFAIQFGLFVLAFAIIFGVFELTQSSLFAKLALAVALPWMEVPVVLVIGIWRGRGYA